MPAGTDAIAGEQARNSRSPNSKWVGRRMNGKEKTVTPRVEIALEHEALLADVEHTNPPHGRGAFWWLGQHTFIVKAGGKVFLIDPFFLPWDSRQTRTLLTPEEGRLADFVLVTHGHGDHLCPETL